MAVVERAGTASGTVEVKSSQGVLQKRCYHETIGSMTMMGTICGPKKDVSHPFELRTPPNNAAIQMA